MPQEDIYSFLKTVITISTLTTVVVFANEVQEDPQEYCTCGSPQTVFSDENITHGTEVIPHSVPFQAGIAYADNFRQPFCGGSLISRNYILTAAHCVFGKQPDELRVVLGEHNTNISGDGEVYVGIESIVLHPSFSSDGLFLHDMALVKLSSLVQLSSNIGIVCLPLDSEAKFVGSRLTVSGWGYVEEGSHASSILRGTQVYGISHQKCFNAYKGDFLISPSHLCAASRGTDSCQGDSGGPLTALLHGVTTQVGIVSSGIGCARERYPGVYARIADDLDWIIKNTNAIDCQIHPGFKTNWTKMVSKAGLGYENFIDGKVECPSQLLLTSFHIEYKVKSGFRFSYKCHRTETEISTAAGNSSWSTIFSLNNKTTDIRLLQNTTISCIEENSVLSAFWVMPDLESRLAFYYFRCGKTDDGHVHKCTNHSTTRKRGKFSVAQTMDDQNVRCTDGKFVAKFNFLSSNKFMWFDFTCCHIN